MKYGDWELRNDSSYYPAQNALLYPSSNSTDNGSLHLESNVRSIVRRITKKSYKLNKGDFNLSLKRNEGSPDIITVSQGEANIQGYHLKVNTSVSIEIPTSANEVTPWTLGISLSYDAENNVTGDVVAYDLPQGQNEIFSGAYLYFFDDCQLRENYDNILVLGRVWEKGGHVFTGKIEEGMYAGYVVETGVDPDPFNDHVLSGTSVEVQVEGANFNAYDALQSRDVPNIHPNVSLHDTTKYEAEQDPTKYTKPPRITLDLQEFLNYMIDWYPSKFGDYMTGALRFDTLSTDAKAQMDKENASEYTKDNSGSLVNNDETAELKGLYHNTESIIISPRTHGKLANRNISVDEALADGGTIMTVVPKTYENAGIDFDSGANYAALVSRSVGDTGLLLHATNGGRSKVAHIRGGDTLCIQNLSGGNEESSVTLKEGRVFIDSYLSGTGGIQLASGGMRESGSSSNIAFRVLRRSAQVVVGDYTDHAAFHNKSDITGSKYDTTMIQYGIGSSVSGGISDYTKDPYMQIGNLLLSSHDRTDIDSEFVDTQPFIRVATSMSNASRTRSTGLPYYIWKNLRSDRFPFRYVNILPGVYTDNQIVRDYFQVGSYKDGRDDNLAKDSALTDTRNRIILYKNKDEDLEEDVYTSLEQTYFPCTRYSYSERPESQIFNKMTTFTLEPTLQDHQKSYKEIGGIYSFGNIGASSKPLSVYEGRDEATGPYQDDAEWVRFTRYRYDRNQDTEFGGVPGNDSDKEGHSLAYGNSYNIEFNTTIANKRSNQLIWHYKGNEGETQPLTLSYIHDSATEYPNSQYVDHNNYVHKNPTFGVRDFLRIDGGGLSIHGDVNNPTLTGDSGSADSYNRFGMTLVQGRVYASVYNDYAETYEKADPEEAAVEGMIVSLDPDTGKYRICDTEESSLVVGVISDNYGMLIGGKTIDSAKDHIESVMQTNNFAVGVSGKVIVNVIANNVSPGDLLVSSSKPGLAKAMKNRGESVPGTIIGKALSKATPVNGTDYYKCLMQIMLA